MSLEQQVRYRPLRLIVVYKTRWSKIRMTHGLWAVSYTHLLVIVSIRNYYLPSIIQHNFSKLTDFPQYIPLLPIRTIDIFSQNLWLRPAALRPRGVFNKWSQPIAYTRHQATPGIACSQNVLPKFLVNSSCLLYTSNIIAYVNVAKSI